MFDFSSRTQPGLPAAEPRWTAFPEFNFVGGHNDADSLPVSKLADACDRVLRREGHELATYFLQSGPQGYLPLREFLVDKLARYAGMQIGREDILLTSGSLQAMDLINAALLDSESTVIVEESNYGGAFTKLQRMNVNLVSVPVDQDGMRMDVLEERLLELQRQSIKAQYIYTIPTVHNPTGSILSLERRHRLLALAEQFDVPVYEDECYADLVWAGSRPPSLHALDEQKRVIHIGSFSKTIAPALRVGYIVADWSLLGQLQALKGDAGSGALEQMLLAEYCRDHFDEHVSALNANLKFKLDTLTRSIDEEFGTAAEYVSPPGGIFLWLKLPESVNTSRLAMVAAEQGIAVNPGEQWSLQQDSQRHIRLCFANPATDTLREGVAKLAEVCHQEFGVPLYRNNQYRNEQAR